MQKKNEYYVKNYADHIIIIWFYEELFLFSWRISFSLCPSLSPHSLTLVRSYSCTLYQRSPVHRILPLSLPPLVSVRLKQVPHQLGALTFYRYEQPIVDYCQAHQPLRLNMGYEGPPQGLEDLGPCDRGTIQTVALPAVPSAASMGAPMPGPRSPPPPTLRPPTDGPSSGPFPPAERTGTLKFGR